MRIVRAGWKAAGNATVVAVTVALVAVAPPARALDMCLTGSGRLLAPSRGACRLNADAVDLATMEDVSRQVHQLPPPVAAGQVLVYDGAGHVVGPLISSSTGATLVLRKVGGRAAALPFGASGLVAPGTGNPYFTSTDCSGAPLVLDQSSALVAFPPVVHGVAYVQSGAGAAQVSHAYLVDTGDCPEFGGTATASGCCVPQDAGAVFAPATATTLDALGLVAPFNVH